SCETSSHWFAKIERAVTNCENSRSTSVTTFCSASEIARGTPTAKRSLADKALGIGVRRVHGRVKALVRDQPPFDAGEEFQPLAIVELQPIRQPAHVIAIGDVV